MKPTTTKNKRNWKKYNQSLINRGRLDIWIAEDMETWWYSQGKQTYSNQCIELILTLKFIYHLPLRATIGLTQSILNYHGLEYLQIPDIATLSRRARTLNIQVKKKKKDKIVLIVDSTGLKVYGEGEWKVRKHGWNYRRTWKKLHIGIDVDGEVRTLCMSTSQAHDVRYGKDMLQQEDTPIDTFSGDGAYDSDDIYTLCTEKGIARVLIPPRKNTKLSNDHHPLKQDNLRLPRAEWKKQSGYHRRSLVETHMYRHKQILSPYLSFRSEASQYTEIVLKTNILNKMLDL